MLNEILCHINKNSFNIFSTVTYDIAHSDYEFSCQSAELSSESEQDEGITVVGNVCTESHSERCKNCPGCVYLLLIEYNMLTNAYPSLRLAYRYLLTLSVTQVACERSFSLLKLVKTRIRSVMSQDRLETFMLMMSNYDIVSSIDNEILIDQVQNHSTAFSRVLKV